MYQKMRGCVNTRARAPSSRVTHNNFKMRMVLSSNPKSKSARNQQRALECAIKRSTE